VKCLCYCVVCCGLMGNLLALDGNGFLGECQKYLKGSNPTGAETFGDGTAFGFCLGYMAGVTETARIWQLGTERQAYCLPEAAENDQLIRVTIKYLEDNPAELHKNASLLVQVALVEAFPCKEGN